MEAGQTPPEAPPAAPTTDELLSTLVENQAAQRAEIAALRNELAKSKQPAPVATTQILTPEELLARRMAEIEQHPFYCPGCGRLFDYQRECTGRPEAPHQPVEVVSTDEIKSGDPAQHTAAPGSE